MKNEHTKTVAPFICSAKKLSSGERLTIAPLSVKTEKHLVFTCDLESLGNGKILIGHGKDITASSWIEITAEEISAFAYYTYMPEPLKPLFDTPIAHGMKIFDFLTVIIDADAGSGDAFVLIGSPSGLKKLPLPNWDGCNGEIFAEVQGAALENCRLSWSSDGFARSVWVLGDSYLGTASAKRWPYYLLRDGYTNLMLSGFPGMGAQVAIEQFRTLVQKGTPEFVLWCLGMNNGDKDGKINANYLSATEEFLAICKANGITPVLSTIPSTPTVDNRYKNEWVRASGHRYVNFSRAVGAEKNVNWYESMLSADLVHPDERGAEALYMQVLCDFPEIMQKS